MGSIGKYVVILSAVLIGGCASIVDKPDQNIAIMSTPGEADFVIKNERGREVHRGVTPSVVNLAKSSGYFEGTDYSVEVSKAGYENRRLTIRAEPSMWYIVGNIATFFIGWVIVDPLTGAMWELEPDMLDIALQSEQAMAPPPTPVPTPAPTPAAPSADPSAATAPEIEPTASANFGALVATFENKDQAELGKTEIWSRHPEVLGNVTPSITYGRVADSEPRYLVIGGGLTNDEALSVCATLAQRNEQCTVIRFRS